MKKFGSDYLVYDEVTGKYHEDPEQAVRDVFAQLVEADFLTAGQQYSGVNKSKDNQPLDNEKSISDNGVENNNTILTVLSTKA